MKPILTAEEMRLCDAGTMEETGLPSLVLMERAAFEIAQKVMEHLGPEYGNRAKEMPVLCICGTGNNGGDGAACARILREYGYRCDIFISGDPNRFSPEMAVQVKAAARAGVPFLSGADIEDAILRASVIVDALFGIGIRRDIEGNNFDLIGLINSSSAYRISADIPSGIDADSGRVHGIAVQADETVTMQFLKRGLILYPGASYAGRVSAARIGILPEKDIRPVNALAKEDLRVLIPAREASGNKGTFGKVLIAAGSPGICGAAYLAASAAFRTGCGMVKIVTHEQNREILQTMLPEAMLALYTEPEEAGNVLAENAAWADVIACGPGIGTGKTAKMLVTGALAQKEKPLVLDADALNVLADDPALIRQHPRVIITPHMGEMSRLSGKSISALKADPLAEAARFAADYGCVCVLKDARTCIQTPGGNAFLNRSGCSGMATAGSGDVLTGITAGLLARRCRFEDAPAAACFLHGLAGEAAAEKAGESGMTAGDIITELMSILKEIQR